MNDQADSNLLRAYAESRSDAAFAELTRRHVDFVYSAALRMVCDSHLAEDVTQSVFVALAKNAGQLIECLVLSSWLHRTARNIAAQTVRTDVRRRAREQEAVAMNQLLAAEPDAAWEQIAPQLDAALDELSDPDREALLLRYFERKSAREMAQLLGVSDEAAQKRVNRAVDRLRELFAKRGVAAAASGLAVAISANAVQAAPAGLAATVTTAAALAGSSVTAVTAATIAKTITMTTLQKTVAVVAAVVVTAALVVQQQNRARLREENESLRRQVGQLSAENESLQVAQTNRSPSPADNTPGELLRLRAEVQSLRRQTQDLAQAKINAPQAPEGENQASLPSVLNAPTVPLTPAAEWKNAGNATPNAALQTLYWAMAQHDIDTFSQALAWDPTARTNAQALFEAAPESVRQQFGSIDGVMYAVLSGISSINGMAVVSENVTGSDGTLVEQHQYADGRVRQNQVNLHHFDDGWRIVLGDEKLLRGFDGVLKRSAAKSNQ